MIFADRNSLCRKQYVVLKPMKIIMVNLAQYGIEESIGSHVILSNFFWWISLVFAVIAYRNRRIWKISNISWILLLLTFVCFGIRELGHFSNSPFIGSIRYIFGIWAAIFMTSAFYFIYMIICQQKKISRLLTYIPFGLALIFPVIWLYLDISTPGNLKNIMSSIEGLAWIFGSSISIFTTYMLGTSTTGDFTRVFMFFQFSAYAALMWKFLGFLEITGYPMPYSIREIIETLFGVFALIAMYILARMLKNLSKKLYGDYGHKG